MVMANDSSSKSFDQDFNLVAAFIWRDPRGFESHPFQFLPFLFYFSEYIRHQSILIT